jgi:Protein of unknown function (DUF3105)
MTNARKSREATAEKAARMRREQAARDRRRKISLIATGVVVVLIIAGGVTAFIVNANKPESSASLAGVQTFTGLSRNHVTTKVNYPQTPPVGGDHNPTWLNCGIYTSPVPNENAVHDLEHGAVWITYQPALAKTEVDKLTSVAKGQTYLDLSPYPGLPSPVVVSAWGKQLKLNTATDPRLEAFIKKYKQGPQTPEPGATCTGGTGTPNG